MTISLPDMRAPARRRPSAGQDSRSSHRGQALIELALILPVLLFLLLGALDLGRAFYANITVASAAKEAALNASSDGSNPAAAAVNEARGGFVTVSAGNVAIVYSDATNQCNDSATFGATVSVTVTAPFQSITPYVGAILGGQSVNMTGAATARCVVLAAVVAPTPTPTPGPTPTPTPGPTPTPTPTPTPSPTPSPTPICKVVPNLVGMDVADARTAWSVAGFTGSFTPDNGQNNKTVLTQNLSSGSCMPATTTITVTHT